MWSATNIFFFFAGPLSNPAHSLERDVRHERSWSRRPALMNKSERRRPAAARGCKDVGRMRGTDDLIMGRSGEQGRVERTHLWSSWKGNLCDRNGKARGLRANATTVFFLSLFFLSHLKWQAAAGKAERSFFFFFTPMCYICSLSLCFRRRGHLGGWRQWERLRRYSICCP